MDDTRDQNAGNPSFDEARDQIEGDIDMLRQVLGDRIAEVRTHVDAFVDEHPVAAIGTAFGIGYVLAGGLFSRMTGRLLRLGSRLVVGNLVRQLVVQLPGALQQQRERAATSTTGSSGTRH